MNQAEDKEYDERLKIIRIHLNEPSSPDIVVVEAENSKFPLSHGELFDLLRKRWGKKWSNRTKK